MLRRLTPRTFVAVLGACAVLLVAVLLTAQSGARRAAAVSAERGLEQAADLVAQLLAGRSRSLAGGARVFVQGPYFRTLVAERRRDDILDQTFEAAEQLEASWVFITDATGVLVAKSDEPAASGDAMADIPLVSGALRGQITSGFGGSGDSLLFLATAVPITAPGGASFGVLVATTQLDSTMAADIAVATGSQVVFYLRDPEGRTHITAATLPLDSAARALLHQTLDTGTVAAARSATGLRRSPHAIRVGAAEWFSYASALNTAGGSEVGGYLVLRPAAAALGETRWLRDAALVGTVLAALVAALAALFTDRTVATPLRQLTRQLRHTADGYRPARAPIEAAVDDVTEAQRAAMAWQRADDDRSCLVPAIADAVAAASSTSAGHRADTAVADQTPSSRARVRRADGALTLPRPRVGDAGPLHLTPGEWVAHRYHVIAPMGGGPSGVVYRVMDRARQETVALKLLRPELIPDDPALRAQRFELLGRMRTIDHTHVVAVHDIGDAHETVFVTSDFVDGISLRSWLDHTAPLMPAVVIALARQLLRALVALHERGLVHGDLKPTNVLIRVNGVVRLADVGIGRAVGRRLAASEALARPRPDDGATADTAASRIFGRVVGGAVGAPDYLAPEQLIGAPPSVPGDLYALGVMLSEARRGQSSEQPTSLIDDLTTRLRQTPGLATPVLEELPTTGQRGVDPFRDRGPAALEALIAALLHPEPGKRPDSARAALRQLEPELPVGII